MNGADDYPLLSQYYIDAGLTLEDFDVLPEDINNIQPREVFVLSPGNSKRYSKEEYKILQEELESNE